MDVEQQPVALPHTETDVSDWSDWSNSSSAGFFHLETMEASDDTYRINLVAEGKGRVFEGVVPHYRVAPGASFTYPPSLHLFLCPVHRHQRSSDVFSLGRLVLIVSEIELQSVAA
jgi:hypothetical protein